MVEQFAQRDARCPIAGNIEGKVGWGIGEAYVVKDVPAHAPVLQDFERSLPMQIIL